jgi:hypothetical protein
VAKFAGELVPSESDELELMRAVVAICDACNVKGERVLGGGRRSAVESDERGDKERE